MWPLASWHELARQLEKLGYDVAVIGGEQEKERGDAIIAGLKGGRNLSGEFSISESAAFLAACRIAVSHDTGAMHLAYAVGTPVVALFSPRQLSSKWYPPQERGAVIQKMVECAGCFRKQCDDNICMKHITVDEVITLIERYVGEDKK
jgi:ADP-heptose:LPS heptosyltransferase